MPFDASDLAPLVASDQTTLWFYRTGDARAAVLAPGYFPAAAGLQPGHVILLQAADSMALLPVRFAGAVGNGIVLDTTPAPLVLTARGGGSFRFAATASAIARTLALQPLPVGLVIDRAIGVSATVSGAVASVVFTLRNGTGAQVGSTVAAPVAAGSAVAQFTIATPGLYRVEASDAAEPLVAQTSSGFFVSPPFTLLTEAGFQLLAETGGGFLR
jgi:hypothetical protein